MFARRIGLVCGNIRAGALVTVLVIVGGACGAAAPSGDLAAPTGADALSAPGSATSTTAAPLRADTTPTTAAPPADSPQLTVQSARLEDVEGDEGRTPIGLSIDALGIDASVLPVGVMTGTGEMDVVDNVRDVGWYQFGASPGEEGSAVLAAHVDLAGQGPGIFFHLRDLAVDSEISVSFDDGSTQRFRVVQSESVLKSEIDLETIFARDGAPMLTLVTCGGGFNPSLSRYDSNVVVTAVPVDGGAA